jgi:hypothetical protein
VKDNRHSLPSDVWMCLGKGLGPPKRFLHLTIYGSDLLPAQTLLFTFQPCGNSQDFSNQRERTVRLGRTICFRIFLHRARTAITCKLQETYRDSPVIYTSQLHPTFSPHNLSTTGSPTMAVERNPKDSMKSTWRSADRSTWTRHHWMYEYLNVHPTNLDEVVPAHEKNDKMPQLSQWSCHIWILTHALRPILHHQLY